MILHRKDEINMRKKEIAIIGGGVSGLTAAIYLSRFGHNVDVYTGYSKGSLATTPIVENFPGFPEGISGEDLLGKMTEQAEKFGTNIIESAVDKVTYDKEDCPVVIDDVGESKTYDACLFATGSTHRKLEFEGSDSQHVHYCATCDGHFYQGKVVAVIGGGDTAFTEALYLANICEHVYLIHRRDSFRASDVLVQRAMKIANIEIITNSVVKEFNENTIVTESDEEICGMSCDGVFIAIGSDFNNELFAHLRHTSRIYHCGDCFEAEISMHQAIIAAGDGARMAIKINEWLLKN